MPCPFHCKGDGGALRLEIWLDIDNLSIYSMDHHCGSWLGLMSREEKNLLQLLILMSFLSTQASCLWAYRLPSPEAFKLKGRRIARHILCPIARTVSCTAIMMSIWMWETSQYHSCQGIVIWHVGWWNKRKKSILYSMTVPNRESHWDSQCRWPQESSTKHRSAMDTWSIILLSSSWIRETTDYQGNPYIRR